MIDLSGLTYFLPLFGFLFVFVVVYALFAKTEVLGKGKGTNLIVSFIIAIIFATIGSAQDYVRNVSAWFVVLLISLLFILLTVGLGTKISDVIKPNFMWIFVVALILVFVFSAIKIFPSTFGNSWNQLTNFISVEARIAGGIILLIIAGLAAWVLVKWG